MKVIFFFVLLDILVHSSVAQLVDGNFEINSCTSLNPPWCEYDAVQEFCPGWIVSEGNIDVHHSEGGGSGSIVAADGTYFVDLNGDEPGAIYQTVTTIPGAHYQLAFIMAGNCNCGPTLKSFLIYANSAQVQEYIFDTTGKTPDFPGWIPAVYDFDATSNSTTLLFVSTTSSSCGPTVDQFVLTALCNTTNGTFHTQSEGDWGDKCSQGFQTGCYRDDNFASCFPNGLSVGCSCPSKKSGECLNLLFTSSDAVSNYLPQLGQPAVLDQSYVNPSNPPPISTPAGNFGGQVTALTLSLGFESCDPTFHTACASVGSLYICDNRCEACKRNSNSCKRNTATNCVYVNARNGDEGNAELEQRNNDGKPQYANCEAFYGQTVYQVFQTASNVLGGCAPCSKRTEERNCVRNSGCRKNPKRNSCCVDQSSDPSCDPVVLNDCITLINQAFIFGKTLNDVDSGQLFQGSPCPSADSSEAK